ncbi:uncharacterized protein LOC125869837 [Solanum stenotomum]|uniref:uncharacterized protein LOC125869837 n=1 Tax=Solanum stenotomum TaxID=172797 RepID=UPI0020D18F75|nr:uncharacterized protein LOC125869837 [Solanum stenotomum]
MLGEAQSDFEFINDNDIEEDDGEDEIYGLLRDLYPDFDGDNMNNSTGDDLREEEPNAEAKRFYRLLKDLDLPLYEIARVSKLSTLIKLLHLKSIGHWSNESFTMLLKFLKDDLLLDRTNLPDSYYEAKKDDNCLQSCKVCGASRWKDAKHSGETKLKKAKKIPCKILRYFPLKPRLQRLFMCSKTSPLMSWHHDKRVDDGIMRHPADLMAWKKFDELHPSFAAEPRNVQLGLASDGLQPFGMSRTPYNIWPVVLVPYNLPPWLFMKQENFILSMLIPGPNGPGDAIDVYLQPLIEELNELWETGVETFDASTRKNFKLHASLLWTINDFPAYANLLPPEMLSGDDILDQVADLDGLPLTKDPRKKIKISHKKRGDNWNRKSIFFDLPYWKTLLLRHNLDVMHIEKNICDNILGTILDIKGKTKDTLSTQLDLQEMNIRKELHPIQNGDEYELPAASYTLSVEEKKKKSIF